jgi:antirestriction protein ArdC
MDKRTQKLEAAHATLTAGIAELVGSDDWARMLDASARFHDYSPRNTLLILMQRPTATRVAGFKRWQELGRQVRKGEKGLAILAPRVVKREDENGDPESRLVGFRVTHVFDIAQTDGDDVPDVRPNLLEGVDDVGLWDLLAKQIADAGFALERGDCDGANGYTRWDDRVVRVRDDVAPAQAAKTLAHELGHVLLHEPAGGVSHVCRDVKEVEAESVAYLVCQAAGLSTDDYTFAYVARWARGDVDKVQATAERVLGCAHRIVTRLEVDA